MNYRIQALKNSFEPEKMDGYIVANKLSILYFTGFPSGVRFLVPKDGENILYVYGVNYEAAKTMAKGCNIALVKRGEDLDEKMANHIKSLNIKRVGFDTLNASNFLKIKRKSKKIILKGRSKLVWDLRKVKDEKELKHIKKAAELTDEGMMTAIEIMERGLRARELETEVEYRMKKLGSEGTAFDTIVASGPLSAFPHGGFSDREISEGELVMLDLGAKYRHYRADLSRTMLIGKPTFKQARIYETVKRAQESALQSIQEGVMASDVDRVAREIIQKEGYSNYFVHGLGHGVGLGIHEPPTLSPESNDVLEVGNVVTVEPGIYIVGFGGVRIEDTVLVQKRKAETLTKTRYELPIKR